MTKTQIVNLAISKLGGSLVSSLGEPSIPGSHHGQLLYEPTLERVLREFPWDFASRETSLAQLPTKGTINWDYSYSLPSDIARILRLQSNTEGSREEEFARTGSSLHCNISPAVLHYVSNDVEPNDFDSDFQNAFVTLLASELATPLMQSPELAAAMKAQYRDEALPQAKASDARETRSNENHGPYKAISESPMIQARFRRIRS